MWFEWIESGAAHFIKQLVEAGEGKLTPGMIANGWTLPQIAALYQDADFQSDPFAIKPGERRMSKTEVAALRSRKRKAKANAANNQSGQHARPGEPRSDAGQRAQLAD